MTSQTNLDFSRRELKLPEDGHRITFESQIVNPVSAHINGSGSQIIMQSRLKPSLKSNVLSTSNASKSNKGKISRNRNLTSHEPRELENSQKEEKSSRRMLKRVRDYSSSTSPENQLSSSPEEIMKKNKSPKAVSKHLLKKEANIESKESPLSSIRKKHREKPVLITKKSFQMEDSEVKYNRGDSKLRTSKDSKDSRLGSSKTGSEAKPSGLKVSSLANKVKDRVKLFSKLIPPLESLKKTISRKNTVDLNQSRASKKSISKKSEEPRATTKTNITPIKSNIRTSNTKQLSDRKKLITRPKDQLTTVKLSLKTPKNNSKDFSSHRISNNGTVNKSSLQPESTKGKHTPKVFGGSSRPSRDNSVLGKSSLGLSIGIPKDKTVKASSLASEGLKTRKKSSVPLNN